jgi:hypothetical protein
MSSVERDPNKRRVKPVETQASILDFDLEEESSDDSDFRIEDHPEVSDDEDDSAQSRDEGNDSSEDEESEGSDLDELKNLNLPNGDGLSVADVIQQAKLQLNTVSAKAARIFHYFFFMKKLQIKSSQSVLFPNLLFSVQRKRCPDPHLLRLPRGPKRRHQRDRRV